MMKMKTKKMMMQKMMMKMKMMTDFWLLKIHHSSSDSTRPMPSQASDKYIFQTIEYIKCISKFRQTLTVTQQCQYHVCMLQYKSYSYIAAKNAIYFETLLVLNWFRSDLDTK